MQLHLDIPILLPNNENCSDCRRRLQEMSRRLKGIRSVELSEKDRTLHILFDPAVTSTSVIVEEVRGLGIELERSFAHTRLHLEGLDCADCALTVEKMLSRKNGVIQADVPAAGQTEKYYQGSATP